MNNEEKILQILEKHGELLNQLTKDVSGLKDEHIRCLEGLAKALKRDRKRRGYSAAGKSRTLNKR